MGVEMERYNGHWITSCSWIVHCDICAFPPRCGYGIFSNHQIVKTMKAHVAEPLLWQDVSVERNEEEQLPPHFSQLSLQKDYLVIFAQAGRGWIHINQTVSCLVMLSCFCCDHEADTLTHSHTVTAGELHVTVTMVLALQTISACIIMLFKYTLSLFLASIYIFMLSWALCEKTLWIFFLLPCLCCIFVMSVFS